MNGFHDDDIEMIDKKTAINGPQNCSSSNVSSDLPVSEREFLIPAHVEPAHKTCFRCNGSISGDQAFIHLFGKHWHDEHFTCKICAEPLGSSYFALHKNVYCRGCYANASGDVCLICKDLIEGFGFILDGTSHKLHSECRVCSSCSVELEEKAYLFLAGGPVFCSPNHAAMECQKCKPNASRKLFYKMKKTKACPCVTEIGLKTSIEFQKQQTLCWYQRNITLPEHLSPEHLRPQPVGHTQITDCSISNGGACLAKMESFDIMNGESTLV